MLGERENVMLDVRALHLSGISGVAEMNRSPQEPDSEAERSDLQSRRVTLSLDDSDSLTAYVIILKPLIGWPEL